MRSSPSKNASVDVDLGLFEDVLLDPTVATPARRSRSRPPKPANVGEPPRPSPSPIVPLPDIVTMAAAVEFLTLARGLYAVTVAGYSNGLTNSTPRMLPAVDIVLAPNEVADAATLLSPFNSMPPWPYDRDVVLVANVLADSAKFCVITYRLDEVTASPILRVEKIVPEEGRPQA